MGYCNRIGRIVAGLRQGLTNCPHYVRRRQAIEPCGIHVLGRVFRHKGIPIPALWRPRSPAYWIRADEPPGRRTRIPRMHVIHFPTRVRRREGRSPRFGSAVRVVEPEARPSAVASTLVSTVRLRSVGAPGQSNPSSPRIPLLGPGCSLPHWTRRPRRVPKVHCPTPSHLLRLQQLVHLYLDRTSATHAIRLKASALLRKDR